MRARVLSVVSSVLVVIAFLLCGVATSLVLEELSGRSNPTLAAVVSDLVCAGVAWLWLRARRSPEAPRPRMGWPDWLFLVLCVPCLWFVGDLCSTCVIRNLPDVVYGRYSGTVSSADPGVVAFLALVVAPLCEETLLRRVAFCSMRRHMPFVVAAVISSALFAGMHMTLTHLPLTFMIGLLCSFAMERSGRLWVPVAVHAACNALSLGLATTLRLPSVLFEPAVAGTAYVACAVGFMVCAHLLASRGSRGGEQAVVPSYDGEVETMSDVRPGAEVSDVGQA